MLTGLKFDFVSKKAFGSSLLFSQAIHTL